MKMNALTDYIKSHQVVMNALATQVDTIETATTMIERACQDRRLILVCGNGGSASDAQHFAAELTGRYVKNRTAYAAVSLATDTSALTAIGNDFGFDDVFKRQVEALGKPGDVLLAISTSGNSKNIIAAIQVAKQKQMHVIALLGRDGGTIKTMLSNDAADPVIVVPSDVTARIQEAHIFILHYFCERLEPQ